MTYPDAPVNLAHIESETTSTQVGLTWEEGSAYGGTPVLDYEVWSDQASGDYIVVASNISPANFIVYSLTAGNTYEFKVRARSSFGYSDLSQKVSVLAAEAPAQPDSPTTTISGDTVEITWLTPVTNGSPITSYRVTLRQSDGVTFTEDIANCDGSLSAIVSSQSCQVPIAAIIESPYSLVWGSSVFANIVAINLYGESASSQPGNGAIILTNPDAPVSLTNLPGITDSVQIGITWQ